MSDTAIITHGTAVVGRPYVDDQGEDLMRLFQYMKQLREPWQTLYEEAFQYMAPEYANWDSGREQRGEKQTKPIYNTKPLTYVDTVSAGFQGYLTPQAGKWVKYETEDERIMEAPGVRQYLQDCQDHMDATLRDNGFYGSLSEVYPQQIVSGTGTVTGQEDEEDEMLRWQAMHPKHVYIHQNHRGVINTWALRFVLTIADIIEQYGTSKLQPDMLTRAKENPFEEHDVIIFIMPRMIRDLTKIDQLNKPWASYHVLEEDRVVLKEGGFDNPPTITGRWTKASDEVYGRGWGLRILSDVLRLNAMTKADLMGYQWGVNPAYTYPAEMREEIELVPGAAIPQYNPNKTIELLNPMGNPSLGREGVAMLEMAIREQLMVNFFLSLLQQQGQRTATEVLEIQGEKAAILGTMIDRPMNETVVPMIARTWDFEAAKGRLPQPPSAIIRNNARIKLNFVGPLAQIAKKFHAHQTVTQTLATFVPLVELSQGEILKLVDFMELGRYVLNEGDFPQVAVRDRGALARIARQEAAAREQAQQMQQIETLGKAGTGLANLSEAQKNGGGVGAPGAVPQ